MLEQLDNMPDGTLGFRETGELTGEDYRKVLEPALRAQAEAGEVRLVYVIEGSFRMAPSAVVEDLKTAAGIGYHHHSAWKRFVVVTDIDWIANATRLFSWATPGEVKVYPLTGLDEAKTWVSG